jgi:acylphosphatase
VKKEKQIIVTGLVQGVGFRSTVKRLALGLRISGYVRNLPDGKVEICAQGSVRQIDSFLENLRANPGAARVERFDVKMKIPERDYSSFEVI